MRSASGTKSGLEGSVTVATNSRMARFAGPSFHESRPAETAGEGAVSSAAIVDVDESSDTAQASE